MSDSTPSLTMRALAEARAGHAAGAAALRAIGTPAVGTAARQVVLRLGVSSLYRYAPLVASPGPAVLIVYAMVNRPYVLDLQPDRSLVRALLGAGLDIYLLDWGDPAPADRYLPLSEYALGRIGACVDSVSARQGGLPVNLLGVCQGGTLSACYAALRPARVARLVTTVTPVDFQTPGDLLSNLVRYVDVAGLVDAYGNVPGELLNGMFLGLRPFRLGQQKYVHAARRARDADAMRGFARMEHWINDSPAQPGAAFAQFVRDLYQRNALARGEFVLGEERVDLRRLTMPVLNLYARNDHIVPPAASLALRELAGTRDYRAVEIAGGHIGLYVSTTALRSVPAVIADWIRATHAGRGAGG